MQLKKLMHVSDTSNQEAVVVVCIVSSELKYEIECRSRKKLKCGLIENVARAEWHLQGQKEGTKLSLETNMLCARGARHGEKIYYSPRCRRRVVSVIMNICQHSRTRTKGQGSKRKVRSLPITSIPICYNTRSDTAIREYNVQPSGCQ